MALRISGTKCSHLSQRQFFTFVSQNRHQKDEHCQRKLVTAHDCLCFSIDGSHRADRISTEAESITRDNSEI